MDLQDLIPKTDTVTIEIKHPVTEETMVNSDGSPMTITLWNVYSQQFKDVQYEHADVRLALTMEKGDDLEIKASELDANHLDMLAKITKEWSLTLEGKKVKLTQDKAKELYLKVVGLRPQLDKALKESEVFT